MKRPGYILCLVLYALFALGCASPSRALDRAKSGDYDGRAVASALMRQAEAWKGVPYRAGGLSKSGIDCSGLVHVTYRSVFNLAVPRTTKSLARVGLRVGRERLRPGDLVFFRTGLRKRHVGIYISGGEFLHASTSRGVTISSLQEDYWDDSYRGARRVLSY